MDSFSWSDSLRALAAPCLACLRSSSKAEPNDLEDLLVDSGSTTTADAETLSLHSNPGAPRRKRARFGKSIRLFGWDLFGRRPPIRLPDDEEEEEEEATTTITATAEGNDGGQELGEQLQQQQQQDRKKKRSHRRRRRSPPPPISTSTLDSDAAPLDSAAIASHATKRAEEEAARAARRARRRERRETKRAAALALALEHATVIDADDAEFEGYPGSGVGGSGGGGRRAAPVSRTQQEQLLDLPHDDDDDGNDDEDDDEEEEEGDFGAGVYARRTPGGSSESGRGSDSRSRTSTSMSLSASGARPYNHHYISQQQQQPTAQAPPLSGRGRHTKNKPSRSTASSKRSQSRSSPSASQSPSIESPLASQFSSAFETPRSVLDSPGFLLPNGPTSLHTVGIERLSSGFPSPGIGGPRNGKRDLGAFLANRGHG